MRLKLSSLILLYALLHPVAADESAKVRVEERTPPTPLPIRVGGAVQMAHTGPGGQWFNNGTASLSVAQIAALERAVATNPEDVCARGYLIAHGFGEASHRMDHVLWMVQHHPEWDGFLLNQAGALSDVKGRVKAAWLLHVGPGQQSGTTLHHAAIFFEHGEPEFAEELLRRAIRLEPEVSFHVEGLGILYGRSNLRSPGSAFAVYAKAKLIESTNWVVVAGAMNGIYPFTMGVSELSSKLRTKLRELVGDSQPNLPSSGALYQNPACQPIPLLRRPNE